jgi:hypothetical protein
MSRDAALKLYNLPEKEFALWEMAYDTDGIAGLRDRRLSAYRRTLSSMEAAVLDIRKPRPGEPSGAGRP